MENINVILSPQSIKIEPLVVTENNFPQANAYSAISKLSAVKTGADFFINVSFVNPDLGTILIPMGRVEDHPTWTNDVAGVQIAYNEISANFKSATGSSVVIVEDETNTVDFTDGDLVSSVGGKTAGVSPANLPISDATQEEIDTRAIISNPLNTISVNDSDLIIANNQSQANTITGTSSLRGIFSGYDNKIGANLASNCIGTHHSEIKDTANHAIVVGGSYGVISGNSSYSVIIGGTDNELNAVRSAMVSCENSNILNGDNGFVGAIACKDLSIASGVGSYIFAGSSIGSIFLGADTHKSIVGGSGGSVSGGYVFIGQGQSNLVQGNRATVLNGSNNQAKQNEALVLGGQTNVAQGIKSTVINGLGCTAYSYNEVVFGNYPTAYAAGAAGSQVLTDRALTIGNGTSTGSRSDALVLLKNGTLKVNQYNVSSMNIAPATAGATGTTGEIRITADYLYVCGSTDSWKRTALTTW